ELILLDLKPRHADAFIAACTGSPSSIRLRIAAASSFFTFLDRETEGRIRNPFLGTKLRPMRESATPKVPSEVDVETIVAAARGDLKAACITILDHGFRVGALPTLQVWGMRYQGVSKGKQISGIFTERTRAALIDAGLDPRSPWQSIGADSLRNRFQYLCKRLYTHRKVAAIYSIHDLRHYFAIQYYRANKDIYALKLLLGHASIQVTEHYLKGMQSYL
ncbi:MAG: tyrosine-type recombinase/integrase, partial [Rectinemataceae bacterium]